MDPAAYCREVETYLCRKNDGHLIRVVGPAFEQVTGWCVRGIPLKVVFRGVDRYVERYYAKGPRRRPVRIEFCEADVLDVFDDWRRAVGIVEARGGHGEAAPARRKAGLAAHLARVLERLTGAAARQTLPPALESRLDAAVREIDALHRRAKGLRGEARAQALAWLAALDGELLVAARESLPGDVGQAVRREALDELASYRDRMPADAFEQAVSVCIDRLVRERFGLPVIGDL